MYHQFKDATAQDSGFCFQCNPACFSKFDKLDKFNENVPLSQDASGGVKKQVSSINHLNRNQRYPEFS